MNISEYISKIESAINSAPSITNYNLNIDRKSDDIAFLSGTIEFRNGLILDFKEFIENAGGKIEKYKYAYNYRRGKDSVFRYDNAPDPKAKDVKTFPFHKHLKDGTIAESKEIELAVVLAEIEGSYFLEND